MCRPIQMTKGNPKMQQNGLYYWFLYKIVFEKSIQKTGHVYCRLSKMKSVIDKGTPSQATCLIFSNPSLLMCCCHPLQHWVLCPLPPIVSSTTQLPCIIYFPLLLCCPPPNCLMLCPSPTSSCCVVGHPIALHCVLCCPAALHCPPPACLELSIPPPLIVFSTTRLPCVVYLHLLLYYPLPAQPPTYSTSIWSLHSPSSLWPHCIVVYCRGLWMPLPPWNTPAHHYPWTLSSSAPPLPSPLSIAAIKHGPLPQPSYSILAAATLFHLFFICHHCRLYRCPLPPSNMVICQSLSNSAACQCNPGLQLLKAIFVASALCHLLLPCPSNAFKHHLPN